VSLEQTFFTTLPLLSHAFCKDSRGAWLVAGVAPWLGVLQRPCHAVARAGACRAWAVHSDGGRTCGCIPARPRVPAGSAGREALLVTAWWRWGAANRAIPMPTLCTAGP